MTMLRVLAPPPTACPPVANPRCPSASCRESLHLIAANSTAVGLPQVRAGAGGGLRCAARPPCSPRAHIIPAPHVLALYSQSVSYHPHQHQPAQTPTPPPAHQQPHLDRTRLCELGDEAFEPAYLTKREELKQLLRGMARPKVGTQGGRMGEA